MAKFRKEGGKVSLQLNRAAFHQHQSAIRRSVWELITKGRTK